MSNNEQYKYFDGATFLEITFPQFWQSACSEKNNFYKYVLAEAEKHISLFNLNKEDLTHENLSAFWQRHCDICLKSITTDSNEKCYCSTNGFDWICSDCMKELKKHVTVNIISNVKDIPSDGFIALKLNNI